VFLLLMNPRPLLLTLFPYTTLFRSPPSALKAFAVALVLVGTAMATNLIDNSQELDWRGIVLGLLAAASFTTTMFAANRVALGVRSEEHTSELQSRENLVCRLLLEKK